MAVSWTHGRAYVALSAPINRSTIGSDNCEKLECPSDGADAEPIHRNDDGSIDIEFYKERARHIHRAAKARFVRGLRHRIVAAFRKLASRNERARRH
jgi:hypothetical protein